MTDEGTRVAEPWRNREFATAWEAGDQHRSVLQFPRALAAELVADAVGEPALVVDIGSGPGDFLAAFLDRFPGCRGVWTDASEAMLEIAQDRLRSYGDRVEFEVRDMTDLSGADHLRGADVVMSSRATHHLSFESLQAFYRDAAALLAPGGWIVNLDHTGAGDVWDARFRRARKALTGGERKKRLAPHRHDHPLCTPDQHLQALAAVGLRDGVLAWKNCHTCLLLATR